MRSPLILAALGLAVVVAPSLAQQERHPAVKARQAYFQLLGANIGPLAAMAKREADYDAETAKTHAANLLALTNYTITPHFPAGTSKEDLPGQTRALPAIWENLDDVIVKYGDFVGAVEELQGAAGEGLAALGPALGQVGGTCKACHDDYQASDF